MSFNVNHPKNIARDGKHLGEPKNDHCAQSRTPVCTCMRYRPLAALGSSFPGVLHAWKSTPFICPYLWAVRRSCRLRARIVVYSDDCSEQAA